ncbi:hypothetical protein SDC9_131982 [bioreactor metagenome]|uniref:Uncharacterized protein n=1 Tax=bioreactor metagenome TaxID=1076179 RepID=A0A645D6A8_9ZZZZ
MMHLPGQSNVAGIMATAAFLNPPILTFPFNFVPPSITNLDINNSSILFFYVFKLTGNDILNITILLHSS